MANYVAEYVRYMDRNGDKYEKLNDTLILRKYRADNHDDYRLFVDFGEKDNSRVNFQGYGIGTVPEKKLPGALVLCNKLNMQYRWVKFYINDEREVVGSGDAIVEISTVGSECNEMVERMVGIMDDAFPEFMKLKWS